MTVISQQDENGTILQVDHEPDRTRTMMEAV
jgi:hypothetical protein